MATKAIRSPLGDQLGALFVFAPFVKACSDEPFAFITHSSRVPVDRSRLNAIFVALRDQAGPMLEPVVVSWVDVPPVAGTTKIADVPA